MYLIEFEGISIGWIQWYRWRDFPEHAIQLDADHRSAGIGLAIGEIEMTGRGLGPVIIRQFAMHYIFTNGDLSAIVADPRRLLVTSMHFIGLEIHKKTISYYVKDVSGKVLSEGTVPATGFISTSG